MLNDLTYKMKMKNKLFFLLLLLTINAACLQAQRDKVILYGDSKFVGKLIFYRPGDSVQLQLKNGEIVTFPQRMVKKVVMEEYKAEKAYTFKERGVYNATYFNLSFGKTNYLYGSNTSHIGVAIENITGFQFKRLVGAGLGLGFDNYYATGNDANVLSVFGEVRGYLSRQNMSPYYSFSSGVGFPMVNTKDNLNLTDHRGGLMVHPAIGLRFGASSKINFFADIGAKYQCIYYNQINTWSENHYRITYLRWVLRGGIMF